MTTQSERLAAICPWSRRPCLRCPGRQRMNVAASRSGAAGCHIHPGRRPAAPRPRRAGHPSGPCPSRNMVRAFSRRNCPNYPKGADREMADRRQAAVQISTKGLNCRVRANGRQAWARATGVRSLWAWADVDGRGRAADEGAANRRGERPTRVGQPLAGAGGRPTGMGAGRACGSQPRTFGINNWRLLWRCGSRPGGWLGRGSGSIDGMSRLIGSVPSVTCWAWWVIGIGSPDSRV
jgi:hypothetical protein